MFELSAASPAFLICTRLSAQFSAGSTTLSVHTTHRQTDWSSSGQIISFSDEIVEGKLSNRVGGCLSHNKLVGRAVVLDSDWEHMHKRRESSSSSSRSDHRKEQLPLFRVSVSPLAIALAIRPEQTLSYISKTKSDSTILEKCQDMVGWCH